MTVAVVTGLGVVAPNGLTTEQFWTAALAGTSGLSRIGRFDPSGYPVTVAGEVTGFHPAEHLSSRLLPQTDHMTRMALVAADQALADAGVAAGELPEFGLGVVTASASGGFDFGQRELEKLWSKGSSYVSAYQSFAWFYAVNTGQISIRHGMRGPSGVLVGEQAGGLDVIAQARRQVRNGTQLMVTGGVDSSLCPWGMVAQIPNGRLSTVDDPARAYLPFDVAASGYVPGEGGAILVVEDADAARRRGRTSAYGVVAGWGATFDPPGRDADPEGLLRAVTTALDDAGVGPTDIDVVLPDAAGTPELDRSEAAVITAVFGPRGVPATAPKTTTGRLYSGGAPLDVAAALLCIRDRVVPPTVGTTTLLERDELDLVLGEPREADVRAALVLARGYGGFNSALVVQAAA
jgi:act minimal PKS chain-length factor (CLF/KS beta)